MTKPYSYGLRSVHAVSSEQQTLESDGPHNTLMLGIRTRRAIRSDSAAYVFESDVPAGHEKQVRNGTKENEG